MIYETAEEETDEEDTAAFVIEQRGKKIKSQLERSLKILKLK